MAERLTAEDARILHLENERIAGHTIKLLVLEGRLTAAELRAHLAPRVAASPAVRRRLVPTPLGVNTPAWVQDPALDLEAHVQAVPLAGEVDEAGLRRIVAELMAGRLDRDRPLWRMDVVERLAGGGSAIVWRIHHAYADGGAVLRLGEWLLWGPEPDGPAAGATAPAAPSRRELLADGLADRARDMRRGLAAAGRALTAPERLRRGAEELRRLPGAARRELWPRAVAPVFAGRAGPRRAVAFAQRPLEQLRRAEHAAGAGATVNDVLLAALAGAVGAWLRERGTDPSAMRGKVPVSMHGRDEHADALGNRDSFLFVDLPVLEADPLARVRAVATETAERKREHDPSTLYTVLSDLSHLSGGLARVASRLANSPHLFAFSTSNVRGPAQPVSVAGVPVDRVASLAEIADGHLLRAAAISCGGQMAIGLCADPDRVPGVDRLAHHVEAALDDLDVAARAQTRV